VAVEEQLQLLQQQIMLLVVQVVQVKLVAEVDLLRQT
jgi:hypothetical protein